MAKRKVSENSLKNLKPFSERPPAERRELGKKGAEKTNKLKAERKTLAELMKIALSMPNVETGEINEIAITNAMINKAAKGDVSAYQTIRDTIGEKPENKIKLDGGVEVQKVFIEAEKKKAAEKHIKDFIDDK